MKTLDDLNTSLVNLKAAVDALPGRIQPPVDFTPQVDQVDALTAQVNAINPATP